MVELVGASAFWCAKFERVACDVAWILRCAGGSMGPSWHALLEGIGAGEFGDADGSPWPQKFFYHC